MKVKIIAEIGWNHMGNPRLAEDMIKSASDSGADIVKFQYWDPQLLKPGAWDTDGRREIYNAAALTKDKILHLKSMAKQYNCEFLVSVFGTIGAEFIKGLGIKNIKIPSHETTNIKLIEFCVKNFESIYFSAGASTEDEVIKANNILKNSGTKYNLMHCVSSYPCPDSKANLGRLRWLSTLSSSIGYSDHTGSTILPALAVSLGSNIIEKHFTTDKSLPGRDNKFALDPNEFKLMTKNIRKAEESLIDMGLDYQDIEKDTVENYRGRWEPNDYVK